jgi:hypothetical protein
MHLQELTKSNLFLKSKIIAAGKDKVGVPQYDTTLVEQRCMSYGVCRVAATGRTRA